MPEFLKDRRVLIGGGVALVVLVVAIAAFALGGNDDPTPTTTTVQADTTTTTESDDTTTTTESDDPTTTTVTAGPPSPLNGMPVPEGAELDRRVIAVKIDNHPSARPQSGIEQADAVWELLVEGGLTRFIGLYHHTDVDFVGPVRSGRPTDPTLVAITDGPLAFSGGQPWIQSQIRAAGVPMIGEVQPATTRVGFRSAPHNLYGNTELYREYSDGRGYPDDPPTEPLFTWGEAAGTEPATEIVFSWSSLQPDVTWKYQGDQYLRFTGANAHTWRSRDGDETGQIAADTLVVLEAPRYNACPSGSGSCVPAQDTVGSGRALVFHGGEVAEGTWARGTDDIPFSLSAADGSTLEVPAGRLWVMVFPTGRPIDW